MKDEHSKNDYNKLKLLKRKIVVLQAKRNAVEANKESKFNMLHNKITDELQKKFELGKMKYHFEKDFEKNKRRIFKDAENISKEDEKPKKTYVMRKRDSQGKIEVTHDHIEKLKKQKQLNALEAECVADSYGLLLFDDLKMPSVASAKLLSNNGDME